MDFRNVSFFRWHSHVDEITLMKLYTHSDTHGATPVMEIGGKASSLLALCQLKMTVPPFVIIPAGVFSEMLPKGDGPNYLEIIDHISIPNALLSNIKRELFTTPETLVAVRSSGIDEDGGTFSFAGQFITELFVSEATLEGAIKKVWTSAYDERVVNYRKHNNIKTNGAIAIIVQRMVNASVAGVAFGMNLRSPDSRAFFREITDANKWFPVSLYVELFGSKRFAVNYICDFVN